MRASWPARITICLIAVTLSLLQAVPADPADLNKEIIFHIASQQLESALLDFSRQADVQVAVASDAVRNVEVQGIQGKLTASKALDLLLRGSGLSYSLRGGTVMVTRVVGTDDGLARGDATRH